MTVDVGCRLDRPLYRDGRRLACASCIVQRHGKPGVPVGFGAPLTKPIQRELL